MSVPLSVSAPGRVLLLLLCLLAWLAPAASAARLPTSLDTGIKDPGMFHSDDVLTGMQRAAAAGSRYAWITTEWVNVAPKQRAGLSDPRDPADPGYDWSLIDRQVNTARSVGLEPVLELYDTPQWAAKRPDVRNFEPRPAAFADFATAAARRYSGTFQGLPRVRAWAIWNEPNLDRYLGPQGSRTKMLSPGVYRALLNAAARAIRAVDRQNLIIAGNTAPFEIDYPSFQPGALLFAERVLCVSRSRPHRATCRSRSSFDIWATHPYTSGDAQHHALSPDSVSMGDLPRLRQTLDAAVRARHVDTKRRVRFWVGEFGWDTNPPDPGGVPLALHGRWTAEALYRAWRARVDTFIWLGVRDYPFGPDNTQCALWLRGPTLSQDTPKPAMRAFRFPFVAYRGNGRVTIWGRTPHGQPGLVTVEQRVGRAWRRITALRTTQGGIFDRKLRERGGGPMRARFERETSLPFSLRRPPDRPVNPFGTQ